MARVVEHGSAFRRGQLSADVPLTNDFRLKGLARILRDDVREASALLQRMVQHAG